MRVKMRILFGKIRPYWPIVAVLALVSLLIFIVINLSFNDRNGAFENITSPDYSLEIPTGRDALTHLSINASDVTLEVGISGNLSKPQVYLFGKGYSDQSVKADISGSECALELEGEASDPNKLTMRVLLPECDLREVSIKGDRLNLHTEGLRSDQVQADLGSGYGYFADIRANNVKVISDSASLRFSDNRIVSLQTELELGSVTLLDNTVKQVDIAVDKGNVFAYARRWNGLWHVTDGEGSIQALTQYRPYNIMISALADPYGSVEMNYSGRYWKHADISQDNDHAYVGAVGGAISKSMDFAVENGSVSIGKRERYSDLDPYADDYPFADDNPYLKERGTSTK